MGGSSSRQEIVNQVNQLVANIFVNISLFCSASANSDQAIEVECSFTVSNPAPQNVYELNSQCRQCFNNVVSAQLGQYDQQRRLWDTSVQSPAVQGSIDTDYQSVISAFIACTANCKACDVANVAQTTTISSVLDCAAFNNVKNSINQQLMDAITQKLTNNQDLLSPLANLLGASSTQSIITNIVNRISAKITDNVISNVRSQISSTQTIELKFQGGGSVQGLTEQSAFHSVESYLQKTNIFNTIFTDAQWTVLQNLINDQNTINELGSTVVKAVSYLERLLTNVVGKVVFFVIILVAVVVFGVILYVSVQLIRNSLKKNHQRELRRSALLKNESAFDRF